jgi:hypothetical protein
MYVADIDAGEGIAANAFDEFDALLGTLTFPLTGNSRVLLLDFGTVTGIRKVTLVGDDPVGIDHLSFSKPDPRNKDECKKGGWATFGFRNQGQCVRFVETGKDSR